LVRVVQPDGRIFVKGDGFDADQLGELARHAAAADLVVYDFVQQVAVDLAALLPY